MEIRKVTVAGAGTLGSQIAIQTAFCGYDVTVYEVEEGLERSRELLDHFHGVYAERIELMRRDPRAYRRGISQKRELASEDYDRLAANLEEGFAKMRVTTVAQEAFADADLVIEAAPEIPEVKIALYGLIAPIMRDDAILASNTSSLLPSELAAHVAHPERFIALHFSNHIWSGNTAEVMPHPAGEGFAATDPEVTDQVVAFATSINMEAIRLNKEQPRYILNSLLMPLLDAACDLCARGVADFETIDRTWAFGNGSSYGPFRIIDIIGLPTYYNILDADPRSKEPGTQQHNAIAFIGEKIAEGRLGMNEGRGFYEYSK